MSDPPKRSRRVFLLALGGSVLVAGGVAAGYQFVFRFPPDTTPQGAYLRITYNLARGKILESFPYLDDDAQHAAFTIRDYRKKASDLIRDHYPEPTRTELLEKYKAHAEAADGADVWVEMATSRGFVRRLRRDLSGIATVEIEGERASVVTTKGTRYPFRKRENGIWGLTLFSAEMLAEAEKAARDYDVVQRAAADYAE